MPGFLYKEVLIEVCSNIINRLKLTERAHYVRYTKNNTFSG